MRRSIEEGGNRRGSSYGTAADGGYDGIFGAVAGVTGAGFGSGAGGGGGKEVGGTNKKRTGGFAGLTSSSSLPVVFALGVLIFVVGAAVGVLVGGTHHAVTVRTRSLRCAWVLCLRAFVTFVHVTRTLLLASRGLARCIFL